MHCILSSAKLSGAKLSLNQVNVRMFIYSNVQHFQCSNVQMFKCQISNVNKVKHLSERTSGNPSVIFVQNTIYKSKSKKKIVLCSHHKLIHIRWNPFLFSLYDFPATQQCLCQLQWRQLSFAGMMAFQPLHWQNIGTAPTCRPHQSIQPQEKPCAVKGCCNK